eukprot:SAG31_NODE_2166_length_6280_cov_4.776250_3_plen_104_part_00
MIKEPPVGEKSQCKVYRCYVEQHWHPGGKKQDTETGVEQLRISEDGTNRSHLVLSHKTLKFVSDALLSHLKFWRFIQLVQFKLIFFGPFEEAALEPTDQLYDY